MTELFKLSMHSQAQLVGVKPALAQTVRQALVYSSIDFVVVEGLRMVSRQRDLYALGRTKPGNIVTWTMDSKHLTGDAVDLVPINPAINKMDWNFTAGYLEISRAMFLAASKFSIRLRWGKDWNGNKLIGERGETDSPHFEILL